jgi:hypothetical protein
MVMAGLALPAAPVTASEASRAPAQHCVQRVTGQQPSGELIVTKLRCHPTLEEAMASEGVVAWGDGAAARVQEAGLAGGLFTLAIHYDLVNQHPAGGSTSTVGTSCIGGWLNASVAWNNRIGSTANGCPSVLHADGFNLSGDQVITFGLGGNLGEMNNRTSSIQYF